MNTILWDKMSGAFKKSFLLIILLTILLSFLPVFRDRMPVKTNCAPDGAQNCRKELPVDLEESCEEALHELLLGGGDAEAFA